MNLIIICLAIFTLFLIGLITIRLFNLMPEATNLEKSSISWGLGVGIISIQLFLYSILKIDWNIAVIIIPWVILGVITLLKKPLKIKLKLRVIRLSKFETILTALILSLLLFTAIESVIRPVQAWDAWTTWVFRPKVFFLHNDLNLDYIRYTDDEYPVALALMGTFGYLMLDQIDDRAILLFYFTFYLAIVGLFFSYSQRQFGTKYALLFTFLLISTQNLIRHGGRYEAGYADLALGYYILSVSVLLISFVNTKKQEALILLLIILGITAQIKNDGIPFFIITNLLIAFLLIRSKKLKHIILIPISFIVLLPWQLYKILNQFPSNFLLTEGFNLKIERFLVVLTNMSKEFLNFQNWNLLWIVFIVTTIINYRSIKKLYLFYILIVFIWLSYFFTFLFTPREPAAHIANIIDRLYLHIAPLAMIIMAHSIYNIKVMRKFFNNKI